MRFRCPKCGEQIDPVTLVSGERVLCGKCKARLKLPPGPPPAEEPGPPPAPELFAPDPLLLDDAPLPNPQPGPPPVSGYPYPYPYPTPPGYPIGVPHPMVVPVPIPLEPPEYTREKVEDLRDLRDDRRERRRHYNEDRSGNPVGTTGFAMAVTALLAGLSGALFATELPAYTWITVVFGGVLAVASLPSSITGCLQAGRKRGFAIAGAGIGAFLLLVLLPAMMLHLTSRK